MCGRVISALKSEALLNESVGAGYIERNWPPALKESGAWPLASLRQSFLNGSLTRLVDPDAILKAKIVEFVSSGELGLASGRKPDGGYERVWFEELVAPDEIDFDAGVFLLRKDSAKALKSGVPGEPGPEPSSQPDTEPLTAPEQRSNRDRSPRQPLPRRPCASSDQFRLKYGTALGRRFCRSCGRALSSASAWNSHSQ